MEEGKMRTRRKGESGVCLASFRRRGLKGNAGKSKVMVLGGEERLEYEVCVDGV